MQVDKDSSGPSSDRHEVVPLTFLSWTHHQGQRSRGRGMQAGTRLSYTEHEELRLCETGSSSAEPQGHWACATGLIKM